MEEGWKKNGSCAGRYAIILCMPVDETQRYMVFKRTMNRYPPYSASSPNSPNSIDELAAVSPVPITQALCHEIEQLAVGLSKQEILEYYFRDEDSLSPNERIILARAFNRGRASAKAKATLSLFNQMNGKDGIKGALSYLVRFAEDWPQLEEESNSKSQHVFKVVMPGEK
jgi:hypothetical protein